MNPLDAIRTTFFEECAELMEQLESGLLELQAGTSDDDTVDSVFRAVHSIKGGGGAFDLGPLVAYAHEFETALDALRSGRLDPSANVVAVLLRACDRLGDLVTAMECGDAVEAPADADLRALTSDGSVVADVRDRPAAFAERLDLWDAPDGDGLNPPARLDVREAGPWRIRFEPLPDLLTSGNEPLHLFRALEVLGAIEVEAIDSDLPSLAELDVRVPRLRWQIVLHPSAPDLTETEIEAVFEFALNLCVLNVGRLPDLASEEQATPADDPSARAAAEGVGDGSTPAPTSPAIGSGPRSIRVDLDRVDRLVNLVGELVISQSMLSQEMAASGERGGGDLDVRLDDLKHLTRELQDGVMAIRAQPVKSLFQRMTRIVREAAQSTGKAVKLEIAGENTEIDKTVVERLAEPLTHMIRNAVDHGLEDEETRVAADKPATGTIRLTARQRADRVVIEVSDDGRGIDRPLVLARGLERGLVAAGRAMDDAEVDRLLFAPGFSTASKVSALSGRGVGLDVVHRTIKALGGTISINSEAGSGCTMSISLPLTLAILDGMVVRSRAQRMVLPLSAILETQIASTVLVETLAGARRVVSLQGRYVPLVDLGVGLGFSETPTPDDDDTTLVFVRPDDGGAFALRVDGIEAQGQVVIKGLADNFGQIPCISAATILGDGRVALIVDPAEVARMAGLGSAFPQAHEMEAMLQ